MTSKCSKDSIDMKACNSHHVSVLKLFLSVLVCLVIGLHLELGGVAYTQALTDL